jgi:hypothetical protein
MTDIEKRARELLAAELDAIRFPAMAAEIRDETGYNSCGAAMVRAVVAAITPPEGYTDAVRDAARYRYIRGVAAGEPTAFGRIEDAAFAAHYGDPVQFDFNIDEQMAGCPEVSP